MVVIYGQLWNGSAVLKVQKQGAREGVTFIENLIINCTDKKFDDFAAGGELK